MKVVVVGGGTGTSVVARALKSFPNLEVSLCVTTFDNGGSAGAVLDEHGALPSSDLIQAILAMMPEGDDASRENLETLRDMLSFRFDEPPMTGKRLGNYMNIPLERKFGFDAAIARLCKLFQTAGQVIPVATTAGTLVAHYSNGQEVYGESEIDEPIYPWQRLCTITGLRVEPEVEINPRAFNALVSADAIIFGPGDLFTSVLPNVVVNGFSKAIHQTGAKLVFVGNLVTKVGQTSGFTTSYFVKVLESYLGRSVDRIVLPGDLAQIPPDILSRYAQEDSHPVEDDLKQDYRASWYPLVSSQIHKQSATDRVRRSLLRHDPILLGHALDNVLRETE